MEQMMDCPRCRGGGSLRSLDPHEEERGIEDTCYHCENGKVPIENAREYRVEAFVARLAAYRVAHLRHGANNDPGGEGWAFHAAEHMMSEGDYTLSREAEAADFIGKALSELDPLVLDLIMDGVDNLDKRRAHR